VEAAATAAPVVSTRLLVIDWTILGYSPVRL
jgi:hypothetical protein